MTMNDHGMGLLFAHSPHESTSETVRSVCTQGRYMYLILILSRMTLHLFPLNLALSNPHSPSA